MESSVRWYTGRYKGRVVKEISWQEEIEREESSKVG
ncbi:hypothetical protein YN1HA_5840 [Sulfurisphaera ohwakuensis]